MGSTRTTNPKKKAMIRKWGGLIFIPIFFGAAYAFVWDDLKTVVLSPTISLEDRMAATGSPTEATTIEKEGVVASAEVQALWAKLEGRSPAAVAAVQTEASPSPNSSQGPTAHSQDALSSSPGTIATLSLAPSPVPATSPAPAPSPVPQGGSMRPSGGLNADEASHVISPEDQVRAALSEVAAAHPDQNGTTAQPIAAQHVERAQRNYNAMLGRSTTTALPRDVEPARRSPPTSTGGGSIADEDPYRRAAARGSNASTILATAPLSGNNQLKEGTTIMAVLKNHLVVGNRLHSADFFTLGATNNLSNVPPGMTLTGMAEMSTDRKRVYINIDKCGSDDRAAPSLPCSAVVRDPSGADGLEGYYFNPRKWERLWNAVAGYLSAPTFTNLSNSIQSLGKNQLSNSDAASLQGTMKDAFQKAADTLRDSLPSDEIRIQAGVIVEIRVTKSVQLW